MRIFLSLAAVIFFVTGCARVRVEGPKEPIKVDISLRLDIYQHVEKDIDDIESIVSGGKSTSSKGDKNSGAFNLFVSVAYAQQGFSPEVESAALRRRDRLSSLNALEEKAIVGEDKNGLVALRMQDKADAAVQKIISEENADRMIIYKSVAQKNNTPLSEVQKLYAKKLQLNAPSGTPIEVVDEATGKAAWETK